MYVEFQMIILFFKFRMFSVRDDFQEKKAVFEVWWEVHRLLFQSSYQVNPEPSEEEEEDDDVNDLEHSLIVQDKSRGQSEEETNNGKSNKHGDKNTPERTPFCPEKSKGISDRFPNLITFRKVIFYQEEKEEKNKNIQ